MKLVPLEKKPMLDFVYSSIDIYANDLVAYGEFLNIDEARTEAKREVVALIPNFIKQDHHFIYQLTCNDKEVGQLWYIINTDSISKENHAFLAYLQINPEHRKKGLGTLAMNLYEQEIRQRHHCTSSTFFVFCQNHPAIGLYEKVGYRIISSSPFNGAMTPTRHKMTKQL